MQPRRTYETGPRASDHILVILGALALTAMFFLVLPLIQAINPPPTADMLLAGMDTTVLPPPPPPPEPEEDEEEEEEETPPELNEDVPPLDLSQLELALDAGMGSGWMAGDFGIQINAAVKGGDVDQLFSASDLDQKPRCIHQPGPVISAAIRKRGGSVDVIFVVDKEGRVQNPIVRESTDPVLERPAIACVKKWKFEPGKRKGEPVGFRMKVTVTFPGG